MKRVLFFGDSITDTTHQLDYEYNLGWGYTTLVASYIKYEYPGEYEFLNRGISGNRVVDLLAREKCDVINLKPDIISILVGVNDIYHEINSINGESPERFYEIYKMLIGDIKNALPDVKIMIMGPFVFPGRAVDEFERFSFQLRQVEEYAKKVADECGVMFVPLWDKFIEKVKACPAEQWMIDGIHPTCAGHEIIKREWLKAFEAIR